MMNRWLFDNNNIMASEKPSSRSRDKGWYIRIIRSLQK